MATSESRVLTRELLEAAIGRVMNDAPLPNRIVVSPRVYHAYDWHLRQFNPFKHIQWRLFLPMWMPRVAWGRRWRQLKWWWRKKQLDRKERRGDFD